MIRGRLVALNQHLRLLNASRSSFVTASSCRSFAVKASIMSQDGTAQGQPGQSSAPHPVRTANQPAPPATAAVNGAAGVVAGEGQATAAASKKQEGRAKAQQKKSEKKADDGLSRTMAALEVRLPSCWMRTLTRLDAKLTCVTGGPKASLHPTENRCLRSLESPIRRRGQAYVASMLDPLGWLSNGLRRERKASYSDHTTRWFSQRRHVMGDHTDVYRSRNRKEPGGEDGCRKGQSNWLLVREPQLMPQSLRSTTSIYGILTGRWRHLAS